MSVLVHAASSPHQLHAILCVASTIAIQFIRTIMERRVSVRMHALETETMVYSKTYTKRVLGIMKEFAVV